MLFFFVFFKESGKKKSIRLMKVPVHSRARLVGGGVVDAQNSTTNAVQRGGGGRGEREIEFA